MDVYRYRLFISLELITFADTETDADFNYSALKSIQE